MPYAGYLRMIDDDFGLTFPHEVAMAHTINGDSLIWAWREYLGLTQKEVAARLGISQPGYSKMEESGANLRAGTLQNLNIKQFYIQL